MRALRAWATNYRLVLIRILVALAGLLVVLLWAAGSLAQAPIPHAEPAIYGRPSEPLDCLACHQAGVNGAPRLAGDHAGRGNEDCLVCHQYTGALPRLVPHSVEVREDCRGCHEAGVGDIGPLIGAHVDYTNEQCLSCHHVASNVPTPASVLPTPTPAAGTADGPTPSATYSAEPVSSSACLDCHQSVPVNARHTDIAGQPKGEVAGGKALYAEHCASCHGENGEQAVKTAAGEDIVISSVEYLGQQDDAAIIVKTAIGVPPAMPAYGPESGGPLSWAEVRSVAGFIRAWAPRAIPVPGAVDVSKGAALYAENCAACHGNEGQGGAVASRAINSPDYLTAITDDVLGQVIRKGTAGMPGFADKLSDEQTTELLAFMRSWVGPSSAGAAETVATAEPAQSGHVSTFPLVGKHLELACSQCHGDSFTKPASTACESCHQPPASHAGMATTCEQCHNTQSFLPASFTHTQVGEHIPSGENPLGCNSCHRTGVFTQRDCSGCHENQPGNGGDD